uniref:Uncharacterized protein n=1 Tax=viral metagenome TaxID=1070528 RepID=A0A6C0DT55_9ZZZZ
MDIDGGESKSTKTFIKYVFNFDEDGKAEFLNVIQYALLAIIPIIALNKAMQKFVPEADDQKVSFEILAEVLAQIIVLFVGLVFINRIVTYVPTYSGIKYPDHNIIFVVSASLMILLSLQTKLGDKVSILVERLTELWEGKSADDKKKKNKGKQGNGTIKVSQPISQNPNQMSGQMIMREAYTDGTAINSLPSGNAEQQLPDYNTMYKGPQTPLVNAATPSMEQMMSGPMAANEALGGSFGGSSW